MPDWACLALLIGGLLVGIAWLALGKKFHP